MIAISPNSKNVALALGNSEIHVKDLSHGNILILEGHTGAVQSVAYSSDSRYIVSGSSDQTICTWDCGSGRTRQVLHPRQGEVWTAAFSSNGTYLAAGFDHGMVIIWKYTPEAMVPHELSGHTKRINAVAFSRDSHVLISASNDHTIRVWDIASRSQKAVIQDSNETVRSVALSPNGRFLASASLNNVRLYNLSVIMSREGSQSFNKDIGSIVDVFFTSNGQHIVSISQGGAIQLWDSQKGVLLETYENYLSEDGLLTRSTDGHYFACVGQGHTIWLWKFGRQSRPDIVDLGMITSTSVSSIQFSSDAHLLMVLSQRNSVHVWSMQSRRWTRAFDTTPFKIEATALAGHGQTIAIALASNQIQTWNIALGNFIEQVPSGSNGVSALTFASENRTLAWGSWDRTVHIWNSTAGPMKMLTDHQEGITVLCFSPDTRLLASASKDGTICICSVSTKEKIYTVNVGELITMITFTPDGRYLKTNRGVIQWDIPPHYQDSTNEKFLEYPLFIYRDFISWKGRKIVWLPPVYRGEAIATKSGTIAIGTSSGRVIFLGLKMDSLGRFFAT